MTIHLDRPTCISTRAIGELETKSIASHSCSSSTSLPRAYSIFMVLGRLPVTMDHQLSRFARAEELRPIPICPSPRHSQSDLQGPQGQESEIKTGAQKDNAGAASLLTSGSISNPNLWSIMAIAARSL